MIDNIYIYFFILIIILISLEILGNLKNKKNKKLFVLVVSLCLIAWLDIYSLLLLFVYSSIIIAVIKKKKNWFNNILYFVVFNIILLIFIKDYYLLFNMKTIYVPLGVSYYFFRLISLVIEYSKNKTHYEEISLLDYYTYVFFFPIFLAGPIQRFKDFYILKNKLSLKERQKTYLLLFSAILIKISIVDSLLFPFVYEELYNEIIANLKLGIINYKLFIFGFFAFIHAYLDLMLYTEISKSISILLGFSKQENFNKPLLATNISQFWQSWHMSLSNWTRDYVFFPTLIKTRKVWLSTYASMMVIGIWHSISLNWILWALLHASALNMYLIFRSTTIYKILVKNKITNILLAIFGNIITIGFVSTVFILVAIHDSKHILDILAIIIS